VMALAAEDLVNKAKGLAAEILETSTDQVTFGEGLFGAPGTNRTLGWQELAVAAADKWPEGLRVRRDNEMHQPVFPNGACMCEIEIDPDTGGIDITRYVTVDDVGRCINPMIVHGQTHGGIAQGVGQALWESFTIDPDSGQPIAASFVDYGMPRFDNLPSFTCEIAEVHSPTNPFGVKAGGEGGTTPAPAVIMSAIEDALAPLGTIEIEMPATPLKIWNAIRTLRARTRAIAQTEPA
jgi:carbon-monoxide dehydrogenase large subunit